MALAIFIAAMLLIVRPVAYLLADNDWFRRNPIADEAEDAEYGDQHHARLWPRFVTDDVVSRPGRSKPRRVSPGIRS